MFTGNRLIDTRVSYEEGQYVSEEELLEKANALVQLIYDDSSIQTPTMLLKRLYRMARSNWEYDRWIDALGQYWGMIAPLLTSENKQVSNPLPQEVFIGPVWSDTITHSFKR